MRRRGIGCGGRAQLDKDSIAAVRVGLPRCFALDRDDPFAKLAERLGNELLEPDAKAASPAGATSVGLSQPPAPPPPATTPSSNPSIVFAVGRTPHGHGPRTIEEHAGVDADERRRNETEVRERGVPARRRSDAGEDLAKFFLARDLLHLRTGSVVTTKRRPASDSPNCWTAR
jgi:hypothetical protein